MNKLTYVKKDTKNRQEEMEQIFNKLENGVRKVFCSDNYINYLKAYSKFHNYSVNNIIYICMQFPNVQHVASYSDWEKKFSRHVKAGSKGINVIVPTPKKIIEERPILDCYGRKNYNNEGKLVVEKVECQKMYFKLGKVFDISQTVGEELPQIVKELSYNSEFLKTILLSIIKNLSVPILYDDKLKKEDANGYYKYDSKEVYIKPSLAFLHQLKTICHELAHHIHETQCEGNKYAQEYKEVIAESCAFCVLQILNNEYNLAELDSSDYSFGYIAGWGSKDISELKESLALIDHISQRVYEMIQPSFQECLL